MKLAQPLLSLPVLFSRCSNRGISARPTTPPSRTQFRGKGETMRNLTINAVVLFALLGTSVAYGQQLPTFKHIVIIIQENRSTDALFGSNPAVGRRCGSEDPFEQGVDVDNGGYSKFTGTIICSSDLTNGSNYNPLNPPPAWNEGGGDHTHYPDWTSQYDSGAMDGACYSTSNPPCGPGNSPEYPPYTYIDSSLVSQYFDIAKNLGGFANYMFQSNQGPSYLAHQFLLSGSSAPTYPGDANGYYQYFVSENPPMSPYDVGCTTNSTTFPNWADPVSAADISDPRGTSGNECYPRNTLVTYQDPSGDIQSKGTNGFTWTYYTQKLGSIWDAPEAVSQVCYGLSSPTQPPYNCTGETCGTCGPGSSNNTGQFSNVALPGQPSKYGYTYSSAPIFDDIAKCNLPSLSWITPDEAWSDHPGTAANPFDWGYGPYWVADIINDIGNSACSSGNWNDTAIFVTWDDWGGFYDHVPPPAVIYGTGMAMDFTCDQSVDDNNYLFTYMWGCGYVYGFRVPLLVASAATKAGYVSGSIAGLNSVTYPPPPQYTHDFGSILNFVENNFATLNQGLGPIANGVLVNNQPVTYADQNSIDYNWCQQQVPTCVPLADFFQWNNQTFHTILVPTAYDSCEFQCYYWQRRHIRKLRCTGNGGGPPMGPDEGADGDN